MFAFVYGAQFFRTPESAAGHTDGEHFQSHHGQRLRTAGVAFAELLRSFGARSESTPVWRISLFTNANLAIVVALSFSLQVWSQHNATLSRFLKTSAVFAISVIGTSPQNRSPQGVQY